MFKKFFILVVGFIFFASLTQTCRAQSEEELKSQISKNLKHIGI